MIRSVATALLKVAAILLFLDLAMTSERYSEANRATGAIRTRTTRALVFKGGWKEKPTWLSERAIELGLNSDHEWQFLGRRTTTHFIWVSRGAGKAPASLPIRYLEPEELSQEQHDQFVARFVHGSEEERENLIRQLAEGSFSVPEFIRELVAIRIPVVQFDDTPLEEALDFVRLRIFELDPGNDPDKKGISMLTAGFGAGEIVAHADPPRSDQLALPYSAKNKRVDEIFTDLSKLYNVEFHVTSIGIVATPSGRLPFPNPKSEEGEIYYTYRAEPVKK